MSRLLLILRWIGAVIVAVIVHVTVLGLGAVIWQHLGTNVSQTVYFSLFLATFLAVVMGAFVVPPEQRKAAVLVLWILVIAFYLWPVLVHMTPSGIEQVSDVVAGGIPAYFIARYGLLSFYAKIKGP